MQKRIRDHIRSNIVGYIALFLFAMGGSAYALDGPLPGQNQVGSDDIINGEVKNADIGTSEVKANNVAPDSLGGAKIADRSVKNADLGLGASSSNTIADGGIQGIDVKNNTLTGTQIDESSLNLAAEGFHVVGSPGEPSFQQCRLSADWEGFVSAPAFFRDPAGVVHLQGNARCLSIDNPDSPTIFSLPAGYRPAAFQNHLVIEGNATNTNVVTISDTTGAVSLADLAGNPVNGSEFITLDGITFRCGPSGVDGCP
jgi:hypothetical protein